MSKAILLSRAIDSVYEVFGRPCEQSCTHTECFTVKELITRLDVESVDSNSFPRSTKFPYDATRSGGMIGVMKDPYRKSKQLAGEV